MDLATSINRVTNTSTQHYLTTTTQTSYPASSGNSIHCFHNTELRRNRTHRHTCHIISITPQLNGISSPSGLAGAVSVLVVVVLIVVVLLKRRCASKPDVRSNDVYLLPLDIDGVENLTYEGISNERENYENGPVSVPTDKELDWNKILRFLARNIHADSWLMLIDCLYGNTRLPKSLNCRERIRRVELDVRSRSHGSEILILEQFKSWKEAAGNNASPDVIKTTLVEMGHMDTLEEFNTYMSNPPYVESSEEHDLQQTLSHYAPDSIIPFVTNFPPPGCKLVKETHSKISLQVSPKYPQEQVLLEVGSKSNLDTIIESEPQASVSKPAFSDDHEQSRMIMKPLIENYDTLKKGGQAVKCEISSNVKSMKLNTNRVREKTGKVKHRRKNKGSLRLCITRKSVELLIESYIQIEQDIEPDIHKLCTNNTINALVKAGIQRASALCVKYSEFCEIERFQTKKGDVRHFLYIGNKLHTLQTLSYDKLQLYADHVRIKVIRRLKNTTENTEVYMFIDHDGNPLKNVVQENVDSMETRADKPPQGGRNQNTEHHPVKQSSATSGRRYQRTAEKSITRKSVDRLIESYVRIEQNIKPDIHDLSTKFTVSAIVTSGIPEESVLCMKYREFSDIETFRTKKGDAFYFLYIGDTIHLLQPASYEKLKLYADHVRAKALQRPHGANEYMFIRFDGVPLHEFNSPTSTPDGDT